MKYNFDEIIDRRATDAVKIEAMESIWGRKDLLPLWVADMDFRTPSFITEAIRERLDRGILGYSVRPESWYTSIINWVQIRFGWEIGKEMLSYTPGIVPGLGMVIQCFTNPGDRVLIQPPVYHPFFLVPQNNKREVVHSPLILENGQYRMDMENFRESIKGCKLFILCNPHNPGGRVWTKEELKEVARICYENNVLVISDEIHADLTLPPYRHIPFATVSEEAKLNSIVFMSPSKAFNIPGLSSSYCIIENPEMHVKFQNYLEASELDLGHIFAFISVVAAYSNGTEWLNDMLRYVQGNIDFTDQYLRNNIPSIKVIRPQASYLVFLDCRELGLSQEKLVDLFVNGAHLALNDGSMFGEQGTGFMRLNVACPGSRLQQALEQLHNAVKSL